MNTPSSATRNDPKAYFFGKPIIGLRTSSHAFVARIGTPTRHDDWPEFDSVVWGGNYHGHHPNEVKSEINVAPNQENHPAQGCGALPMASKRFALPIGPGGQRGSFAYGKVKGISCGTRGVDISAERWRKIFLHLTGHPKILKTPYSFAF